MQKIQLEETKIEECYTAEQEYAQNECYNLETNIGLQYLEQIRDSKSILEIRDQNQIRLNNVINKKKLELFLKKQQQQQQQQSQQNPLSSGFSMLQYLLSRFQGRSGQQQDEVGVEDEDEEEEYEDMEDEEYQQNTEDESS